MAQDVVNPLQNISYTHKDFTDIYTELLDLVNQLTNLWVPNSSNESDPGVILLKINSILGDKLNYNIDKNVLECFPLSVTQEQNARQLFRQLGYNMHWYRAASTTVFFNYIGSDALVSPAYRIPRFTMLSDYDDEIVYTILDDAVLAANGDSSDEVPVMQGVCVEYEINNSTWITVDMLDYNNRLYFNELNVAENGIFIANAKSDETAENYSEWSRVDNVLLTPYGAKVYEFGVSDDGQQCYIEFSDDAEELFGSGIRIKYLRTQGTDGNIAALNIQKFYNDLTVIATDEASSVTLTYENTRISNYGAALDGKNPETINEAYRGYKRTVGTFDTLITLRDYINAILRTGRVSNCFVCDRTNDIQTTYKVMTSIEGANQTINVSNTSDPELNALTAFDLKLYLLQYVPTKNSYKKYDQTFTMLWNDFYAVDQVKALIEDNKLLQHDYKDLLPVEYDGANATSIAYPNVCFFINKYPVNCTIVPQYQLTVAQKTQVIQNVKLALFNALCADELDFGEEISYDYVKKTIEDSDSRIKTVSVDRFEYSTVACYFDNNGEFNEVEISTPIENPDVGRAEKLGSMKYAVQRDVYAKSVLAGNTQLLVPNNSFSTSMAQIMNAASNQNDNAGINPTLGIEKIRSVADITLFVISIFVPAVNTSCFPLIS